MADESIALFGRHCLTCGVWKQTTSFFSDKRRKHIGRMRPVCKDCTAKEVFARRDRRLEEVRKQERESKKRRRHLHVDKINKRGMLWRLKNLFNLSEEQFWEMFDRQDGKCAICAIDLLVAPSGRGLRTTACIDHDHVTGKVREILCNSCNVSLGMFKDNVVFLQRAIEYLRKHKDE